jgi:hypothetical protein
MMTSRARSGREERSLFTVCFGLKEIVAVAMFVIDY